MIFYSFSLSHNFQDDDDDKEKFWTFITMAILSETSESDEKEQNDFQEKLLDKYQRMDLSWYELLRLLSRKTTVATNGLFPMK